MPYSRLSWVLFLCTLRRSAEHTSSDCIWGFSQSVPTSDSQVTSASGLSAWCCAGRVESGRTRDWLIRADKIKLQYKKEPAGHLNLMTLTCWFLFAFTLLCKLRKLVSRLSHRPFKICKRHIQSLCP